MTEQQRFVQGLDSDELNKMAASMLPIIKIDEGRYLIGTEVKTVVKTDYGKIFVHVGGGYQEFQEHIDMYSTEQSLHLYHFMKEHDYTF